MEPRDWQQKAAGSREAEAAGETEAGRTSSSQDGKVRTLSRLAIAGVVTAVLDGLFSSVLSVAFYHSTVTRLFQGVASVLLGPSALDGGARTAAIGVLMHVGVAFGWSAVFLLLVTRSAWIRSVLASPQGPIKVASLYGPFVWMVMSLAVIPLLAHRPPAINVRWWVQLIGHIPFVGFPIVWSIGRDASRDPMARRPVVRKSPPKSRSGAVAVAEPDE